jgi:amidohydrolase
MVRPLALGFLLALPFVSDAAAQTPRPLTAQADALLAAVQPELIEWRRHLHQHPELSNREVETAKYVAERLRSVGLEPRTGIARHGVVAVLQGGRPGPMVALRADMHACGHDTHVAILLATAKVLAGMRAQLPGSVTFIFQPAEEGAPLDERPAGAELMVKEGVMKGVDAVFGLHVFANVPAGTITYRSGPFMAAADQFDITITGRQTHGSAPWRGVDPIVVGAQIVGALQTIVSRNVDITRLPAIVSVGQFQSGVRNNIIPETAKLVGTIRTFDHAVQDDIHARVRKIAEGIALAAGAKADVQIHRGYPVTANDPALTTKMLPTLERAAPGNVRESELITGAEDFTYFQREAPGLFIFLGITPPDQVGKAPANHSPLFFVDEGALPVGVRALTYLALDYLSGTGAR